MAAPGRTGFVKGQAVGSGGAGGKAQPAAAVEAMFAAVPAELKSKVPALFESPLAAVVAMRRRSAA